MDFLWMIFGWSGVGGLRVKSKDESPIANLLIKMSDVFQPQNSLRKLSASWPCKQNQCSVFALILLMGLITIAFVGYGKLMDYSVTRVLELQRKD
ncbi:MAG: hypothetical protein KF789_05260 [Bdellovibrionaceae bacterium]|nr:hypothetical protein [Pseudobdellovibrionaceae bacterium]